MRHDPELVAETHEWLVRAGRDLVAAAHDLTAEPPLLHDVAFHAQQAAEKTFKGFLTWHGRPFRKTHNLEELGQQCLEVEPELKATVDRAVPLTDYAWKCGLARQYSRGSGAKRPRCSEASVDRGCHASG